MQEAAGRLPEALLICAGGSPATLHELHRQIAAEDAAEAEFLVYDKAGSEIWISTPLNAIRQHDGQLKYLVSVMIEVTERKQLEALQHRILEALADEQPLLNIMDNLCRQDERIGPDGVCLLLIVLKNPS